MRSQSFRRILKYVHVTCTKVVHYWLWLGCGVFLRMPSLLVGEQVQGAIVEVSLLQGDEEEAYWEETNRTPHGLFLLLSFFGWCVKTSEMAEQWQSMTVLWQGNERKLLIIQKAKERMAKERREKVRERSGRHVCLACVYCAVLVLSSITPCHLCKWTCFCAELSWNWWYIDIDVRGQEGKEQGQERRLTLGWAMCTMTVSCKLVEVGRTAGLCACGLL